MDPELSSSRDSTDQVPWMDNDEVTARIPRAPAPAASAAPAPAASATPTPLRPIPSLPSLPSIPSVLRRDGVAPARGDSGAAAEPQGERVERARAAAVRAMTLAGPGKPAAPAIQPRLAARKEPASATTPAGGTTLARVPRGTTPPSVTGPAMTSPPSASALSSARTALDIARKSARVTAPPTAFPVIEPAPVRVEPAPARVEPAPAPAVDDAPAFIVAPALVPEPEPVVAPLPL